MTDFIRKKSMLSEIPDLLSAKVFGFKDSVEYREMADYERDIPGVVAAAFAKYLCRIHRPELSGQIATKRAVKSCHDMLDNLAASSEAPVRAIVTDEIFENFDCEPAVLEDIKQHLKFHALDAYRQWSGET